MDWQLTCRVCLESGDMVSIFDWDENNEQLSDKYTFCCGVEVTKTDTLPTLICLNCVDKLTFSYQFKQQCLSSNETLKECLEEFQKSSAAASATKASNVLDVETITIKQENGLLLQYELPVEHDPATQWTRTANVKTSPKGKKRGRPKKNADVQGEEPSTSQRKKGKQSKEKESDVLTSLINSAVKEEPVDNEEPFEGDFADDPDYAPDAIDEEMDADAVELEKPSPPKKRGRRPKSGSKSKAKQADDEDVLLKETILAFSEPIPDHILNPKPKKKYPINKKKYVYQKTHICETCGTSFSSNSALQTHIRRHLGIKPFVCRYSAGSAPERVCQHSTKSLQCSTITDADLMEIHTEFYSHQKKYQDSIILNSCSVSDTNRLVKNYKGRKQTTLKFSVFINNKKVPICKNFFLSIYRISKHRVSYVMNRFHYNGDVMFDDRRGGDRKDVKYRPQKESIHKFIQQFKYVETHYCRKTKTPERKYLNSDLNIRKLYDIYKSSEFYYSGVKMSYFRSIFTCNYNIGFGSPKNDACSTCLELSENIKKEKDFEKKKRLMIKKRVHTLQLKAFCENLQNVPDGTKIISFDFQRNLPFPKLPDQMTHCTQQLYFYNLTMVEGSSVLPLSNSRVFSYYCTENEFNKDSNLVASALYHRLSNTDMTGIKNVRLVTDGCGGQKKNCILIGACSNWLLSNDFIESIEIVFSVNGHSSLPTEKQFGVIEKKLRKLEVLLVPGEITRIASETSTVVRLGVDCPVTDWIQAVNDVVKITETLSNHFRECKRFILQRSEKNNNVLVHGETFYKSDLSRPFYICQKNKNMSMISPQVVAVNVPINKDKLTEINILFEKHFKVSWRELPTFAFYKELYNVQEQLLTDVSSTKERYCDELLIESDDMRI